MKKSIQLLALLLSITVYAQQKVSLSVHQDVRLLITGDKIGNDHLTLNLLTRVKLQGKQDVIGYAVVAPSFEIANIEENYKRYSVDLGYTFNEWSRKLESSIYVGFGFIDRWGKNYFSFNSNAELSYKLNDNIKVSALAQFTERKDLKYRYNDTVVRMSGFIGIELNL